MLRLVTLTACALLLSAQASPAPTGRLTPPRAPDETLAYQPDPISRMTVAVSLGGQGPFRFVVDTGAERTVISRELADRLGLASGGDVWLASLADVQQVPTVIIPRLDVGRRAVEAIQAPALAQANIGAQGMLGVDSLQDQRIVFDFQRRELRLTRARTQEESVPEGTIVVRGRTRLGRMVLADAMVDGQRVWAIVDTGSPVTIGNEALRQRLIGRGRMEPDQVLELTSVTGAQVRVNYTRTRRIRLGQARIYDMPIAFAGLRLFEELDLTDRPAILLGMDALRLFQRVSIDFAQRRIQLLPGPSSEGPGPLRLAAR